MVCRYFLSKHFFMTMFMVTMWQTSSTLRNLGDQRKDHHTTELHCVSKSLRVFIYFNVNNVHIVYVVVSGIFSLVHLTLAIYSVEKILCRWYWGWQEFFFIPDVLFIWNNPASLLLLVSLHSDPIWLTGLQEKQSMYKSIPLAALFSWGMTLLQKELSGDKMGPVPQERPVFSRLKRWVSSDSPAELSYIL